MKKMLLCIVIAVASLAGQSKEPCCSMSATEEFSSMGGDLAFVALHEAPEPFSLKLEGGSMKMIPAADKKDVRIFEVKAANPTNKYLFVFQEWWGLNDYIKLESEKLQKELGDVTVIALDLYDGKIATTPQEASQYVQSVKDKRIQTIIKAAIQYVGKDAKIATLGWCFGGGWSLQSALLLGKQAVGCVVYYGMPEKDVKKLKTLNCDVLGIFGTQDQHISPKVVAEFQKNMKAAKKNLEVHNYDAVHAFANPSNPKYDKVHADDAHEKVMTFLKAKFGL
ncbi:MAG: dienelactone hydrolase family protein [Bacteroidota bacterium]